MASSTEILPSPFEWIDIPAGRVEIEGHGKFEVPMFAIAKYPITNAQYAKFIEADGYQQRQWWTEDGWQAKERGGIRDETAHQWIIPGKAWTQPRCWGDEQWGGLDHPVVGVSWYEAMAFCGWLSEQSGEKILLPTEQQWQRAAQGDDGRAFPWGNEWDCQRCNNSVKPCRSTQTTSVRKYEGKNGGDSPFGVTDMCGNVEEWCLTEIENELYEDDEFLIYCVVRSGSWHSYRIFHLAVRKGILQYPGYGYKHTGFRCARIFE